jgi:hypothetical protein
LFLEELFTVNRGIDIFKVFVINKSTDVVYGCETIGVGFIFVFTNTDEQIIGYADIERTILMAG